MENTSTHNSFFSDIYKDAYLPVYAGFWVRFVAYLIDMVVLMIPNWIISMFIVGSTAVVADPDNPYAMIAAMSSSMGITFLLNLLYFPIMESSSWQGTLGKRALDLKVIDERGGRLSFGRALGRTLAKYLSAFILLIGYIMAAFSSRKQALHDKIVGTFVVKTR